MGARIERARRSRNTQKTSWLTPTLRATLVITWYPPLNNCTKAIAPWALNTSLSIDKLLILKFFGFLVKCSLFCLNEKINQKTKIYIYMCRMEEEEVDNTNNNGRVGGCDWYSFIYKATNKVIVIELSCRWVRTDFVSNYADFDILIMLVNCYVLSLS